MISIRECSPDIDSVKAKHVAFVGLHVKRVINFYIDILKLIKKVEKLKRYRNEKINEEIKQIKLNSNSTDYRGLLQVMVKRSKGTTISDENKAFRIKYSTNRIQELKKTTKACKELEALLVDYNKILEIDFAINPSQTEKWYKEFDAKYSTIKVLIPKIFDYEKWFSVLDSNEPWGPYQLTKALNLDSCPYCNRQYTFTITGKGGRKIARPELDHFFPKSLHPMLSVSFYNLIPSCSVCNSSSVKGTEPTSFSTHLSPYEKNANHSLIRFTYFPTTYSGSVGLTPEICIEAKYNGDTKDLKLQKKVEGNIKMFCLNELYSNHVDSVQEIIWKREMSGDKYIEVLQDTFTGFPIAINEAYRLAFGNYYDEKDFSKRTLSKLTKDIAIEIGTLIRYK